MKPSVSDLRPGVLNQLWVLSWSTSFSFALIHTATDNILGFHLRDFCLDDGCYPACWCPNKRVQ